MLDALDPERVGKDAAAWEKVVRKVRTGMMPPSGARRPERALLDAFASDLEGRLDRAAAPGASLDAPSAASPEPDRIRERRSRSAGARRRRRDAAAGRCLERRIRQHRGRARRLAVAHRKLRIGRDEDQPPGGRRSDGLRRRRSRTRCPAVWSRTSTSKDCRSAREAALLVQHTFPLDAEYEFSVSGGFGPGGAGGGFAIDVTLDGEQLKPANVRSFRIPVTAGPHTIGAALVERTRGAGVDEQFSDFRVDSAFTAAGGIQTVVVTGPFKATSAGDTPSRHRIFVCQPVRRRRRSFLREQDRLDARAPRLSPAGAGRGSRDADEVLREGSRRRRLRSRHPAGAGAHSRRAGISLPRGN